MRTLSKRPVKLRDRVEEFLHKNPMAIKKIPPEDIRNLFEDLQIYQTELEKYNNELRKTQIQLREREENFRALAEKANDGILIAVGDGDHVFANKRAAEITGYSVSELIETSIKDLAHPDEYERIKERYKMILAGKPYKRQYETVVIRKEGKEVPIEVASAKSMWHGQPADIVVIRDITERKLFETSLRDSVARYRAVVENQTEMICCFLPNGTITFVNDAYCRYFNKHRDELIGHKFLPLIPESEQEKVFKKITSLNPSAPIVTHEHRVVSPNSEIRWHKWTNRAIFDNQNQLLEYQAVGWDITERVRAEEALRKAHNMLERRVEERTKDLEIKTKSLEELNTAMKVLLEKRREDKTDLEDSVLINVAELIEPYFNKMKRTELDDYQKMILSILESNLKEIISPFTRKISLKHLNLTPTEIKIVNLIRHGATTKKIAEIMNISPRTVDTHRKNIRRKIGLDHKRANLRSYLLSLH